MENGYELIKLTKGYLFKEGKNTFLQLISQLNSMKIEAQLNKQPTIRNLAKLLMNSMYGRFGMQPSLINTQFKTEKQLITQLNSMKIEAQRNSQPTIRNLAKLLMNSMYGRFGMHPTLTQHGIYTSKQMNKVTPALENF
jgi:hypothetical protein